MSNTTLIIGESGTGKSSSLRNLLPETTFIINVLDKPLPFRRSKHKYNKDAKNYVSTDNYSKIIDYIDAVDTRRPDINVLIIDDFQYIMANEFMARATEKGFDKFSEMANHAWAVVKRLTQTRDDLYCFVLAHSDTDATGKVKCKTIGKMLDEKITLEGMFTSVLHTQIIDGNYQFLTQFNGTHIAKSPMGMFSTALIENDLKRVLECMYTYNNDEEQEK